MRRLLLFVLVACGGSSGSSRSGSTLVVQAAGGGSLSIPAGGTVQLQALERTGTDAYGGGGTLTQVTASWSSANPGVATVDGNGLVRGVAAGSGVAATRASGANRMATVTVGAGAAVTTIEWTLAAESNPVTTTVSAGTPVQWHAADATHSIVADTAPPPNTVTIGGGTTSPPQTIAAKGTYPYHCGIHPTMRGTLIVQ